MEETGLMAKLTKIQKLMRDRPEMFDFGDIPPARVKHPEQEAAYEKAAKAHRKIVVEAMGAKFEADCLARDWEKQFCGMIAGSAEANDAAVDPVEFDDDQPDLPGLI